MGLVVKCYESYSFEDRYCYFSSFINGFQIQAYHVICVPFSYSRLSFAKTVYPTTAQTARDVKQKNKRKHPLFQLTNTSPLDMAAKVMDPDGHVEDVELRDLSGDGNYLLKFFPKKEGLHTVSVLHKGQHVAGKVLCNP